MAEQWPYRSSLLMQVQDHYKIKMNNGKDQLTHKYKEERLINIYKEKKNLLSLPKNWQDLSSLDENPDIFESFLAKTELTCESLEKFLKFTINIDFSLKETFAMAIAQNNQIIHTGLATGTPKAPKSSHFREGETFGVRSSLV